MRAESASGRVGRFTRTTTPPWLRAAAVGTPAGSVRVRAGDPVSTPTERSKRRREAEGSAHARWTHDCGKVVLQTGVLGCAEIPPPAPRPYRDADAPSRSVSNAKLPPGINI